MGIFGSNLGGIAIQENLEHMNGSTDFPFRAVSEEYASGTYVSVFGIEDVNKYPYSVFQNIAKGIKQATDPESLFYNSHLSKHGREAVEATMVIAETLLEDPAGVVIEVAHPKRGFSEMRLTTCNPLEIRNQQTSRSWILAMADMFKSADFGDLKLHEKRYKELGAADYIYWSAVVGMNPKTFTALNVKGERVPNIFDQGFYNARKPKEIKDLYKHVYNLVRPEPVDFPNLRRDIYKDCMELIARLSINPKNFREYEVQQVYYPTVILRNAYDFWLGQDPEVEGARNLALSMNTAYPMWVPIPRTAYIQKPFIVYYPEGPIGYRYGATSVCNEQSCEQCLLAPHCQSQSIEESEN